jgi:hypothetical protein
VLFQATGGVIFHNTLELETYRIFFPYAVGLDFYEAESGELNPTPEELRAWMKKQRWRFLLGALTRQGRSAPKGWTDDSRIEITRMPNGSPEHQAALADRWELERPRSAAELEEITGLKPSDTWDGENRPLA